MSSRAAAPANAYTDAPELHPNLILASLQLLLWIFFHPSAWRSYVGRIDPALSPDFVLTNLSREQWRDPALRQLLSIYLIWTFVVSLLAALLEWIVFDPPGQVIFLNLLYKTACNFSTGAVVGAFFNLPTALMFVGAGVMLGPSRVHPNVLWCLGISIAMGIAPSISKYKTRRPVRKQARGIVTSVLLCGLFVGVMYGLLIMLDASEGSYLPIIIMGAVIAGVAYSIALGWHTHEWLRGIIIGSMTTLGATLAAGIATALEEREYYDSPVRSMANGVASGLGWSIPVTIAYAAAARFGGVWAAAIAASLIAGASDMFLASPPVFSGFEVCVRLAAILGGLTLRWWRPLVSWPFEMAWGNLLYHLDGQRPCTNPSLLRLSAAFWDEHQRARLYGLEDHIVLVAERNPVEAQAAIEYLSTSSQRWAAQAAQIELDARQLERCANVEALGHAHRSLAIGALEGPASALLHSFNSISRDIAAALSQTTLYHRRLALGAMEDRLNGLLRELTRSSERYAVRFRPIAVHWHRIVREQVREMASDVEQRQEIENPYIVGVPLGEHQQVFVGRADISAQLEKLVLDQRGPPLLLYGQRRMGKTSLLNNLGRLLPTTIVPLFVDLQGPASSASGHAGLLYSMAKGMVDSASRKRGLTLSPLPLEELTFEPFVRFDEWLDRVEETLVGNTALLILDEMEALDGAIAEGRFNEKDLFGMLRHLIQHRRHFKVLLAASHTLEELRHLSSYLINVQVVKIGYLKKHDARRLIEQPIEGFALRYEPDATRRVLELAHGHPALTQLLCYEIVALKNEHTPESRRLAMMADVEAAATRALDRGTAFFFHNICEQVGDAGVAVLRFLATQGEGAVVDKDVLAHQFPDELDSLLALLLRRDLIETVGEGYRFQVELVRRWFTREAM